MQVEDSIMIFAQSFNRLMMFLPIIGNLNQSCLPQKWQIKGRQGLINDVRPPVDDKEKAYVLESFQHLTYRHLLRDCIESFALGLDDFYTILKLREKGSIQNLTEEDRDKAVKFANAGLFRKKDGKLQQLKKDFGLEIPEDYRQVISSLKDIRDCLSHSAGVVMPHHGLQTSKPDERKFSWFFLSVFAVGNASKKRYEVNAAGQKFPEPVTLMMETKTHYKNYKIGEFLLFSQEEAFEIANSLKVVFERYIIEANKPE